MRCTICNEFSVWGNHKCPPSWEAQIIDDDIMPTGDWEVNEYHYGLHVVYAKEAEDAAEKTISESSRWYDSSSHSWRVIVCPKDKSGWREKDREEEIKIFPADEYKVFDVRVEAEPVFYADEVKKRVEQIHDPTT